MDHHALIAGVHNHARSRRFEMVTNAGGWAKDGHARLANVLELHGSGGGSRFGGGGRDGPCMRASAKLGHSAPRKRCTAAE
jgi:hypothetical protein